MKGLAIQDIITEIQPYVMAYTIPSAFQMDILQKLADIEYRLSIGGSEKLNLGAMIACFQIVKEELFKMKADK